MSCNSGRCNIVSQCGNRKSNNCGTVSCWIPRDTQRRTPSCTDLVISITQTVIDLAVIFNFTITNNGPLPVNNAVLTVTFSGLPPIIIPPGVIIPGNVAILNIGTIEVGQSFNTLFGFSPDSATTVVGTVTAEIPICNPSNSTATSTFTPID